VSTLVAVVLVFVGYLFVVSLESKNVFKESSAVFVQQVEQLQDFELYIQQTNNKIIHQIQNNTLSGTLTTELVKNIEEQSFYNNKNYHTITVYTNSSTLLYGQGDSLPQATNITVANIQQQQLEYWFVLDAATVNITYNLEPIITIIQSTTRATHYTKTARIELLQTKPAVYAEFFNNTMQFGEIGSVAPNTGMVNTVVQLRDVLLQNKPLQLSATTQSNWNYILTVPMSAVHKQAQVFVVWLLVFILPLLLFVTLIAKKVGKSITGPIKEIATKLQQYTPGVHEYTTTIHTSDELETLDSAISVLAGDLSRRYSTLEKTVQRTAAEVMKYSDTEHAIFDAIALGIAVVDTQGTITEANRTMAILLHTDIKSLIHTSIFTTLPLRKKEELLPKEAHPVFQVLTKKRETRIHPDEHINLQLQHRILPLRMIITPINTNNELRGAVIVVQDATEEYKIEKLKNDFIAVASHQLRTPLASIQWYSELLSSEGAENFTNTQREFMVELRLAAQKLGNVINELMDATRLHDDEIQIRPEECNIVQIVEQIIAELESTAKINNITITKPQPNSVPAIQSDPILLGIVVQNLVTNAIKYSHSNSSVTVNVGTNESEIFIAVTDSGIGIPQKDQDYIFQKMYRGSNAKNIITDGNGLGLYATRKIVHLLGGTVTFVSQEGVGTTFTVHLPITH
jgi:two-component system, OmpR family, sensor histidine kinase VicK